MGSTLRRATLTAFVLGLLAAPAFAAGGTGGGTAGAGAAPGGSVGATSPQAPTTNGTGSYNSEMGTTGTSTMNNSTSQLPSDAPAASQPMTQTGSQK